LKVYSSVQVKKARFYFLYQS